MSETKNCIKCGKDKDISDFRFRKDTQKYMNICVKCVAMRRQHYYNKNKKVALDWQSDYYKKNQNEILEWHKDFYLENRDDQLEYKKNWYAQNIVSIRAYQKIYRKKNKVFLRSINNQYLKLRRKSDPAFKLRKDVSRTVSAALKSNNGSKNGWSIMDYLPYSIEELKQHLEKQFESWMTWDNHGKYNPNIQTWQIDHIIPQSLLLYASMDDENFQKCWALDNLQPLKAIDNIKKGNKIIKSS